MADRRSFRIQPRSEQTMLPSRLTERAATILLLLLLFLCLPACGTLIHGRFQTVRVTSDPPGARAMVSDVAETVTPGQLRLFRGASHRIRFEKPGFEGVERRVDNVAVLGTMLGNLMFGGVIFGLAIDHALGGLYELQPAEVSATLHERTE